MQLSPALAYSDLTHPLLVQLQQSVADLGRIGGQAQTVQVELRHYELQQPLGREAPGRCVASGRRHRLLQNGTSQRLHLQEADSGSDGVDRCSEGGDGDTHLCSAEDDAAVVLSSTGSFLLLSAEADGHGAEAVVHAKEVLVFCGGKKVNDEEQRRWNFSIHF